jgi:hypothetical protein
VLLGKVLGGCQVGSVGLDTSQAAGVLCGKAGSSDVVEATVVVMATALSAIVWTSDPKDIRELAGNSGARPALLIRAV